MNETMIANWNRVVQPEDTPRLNMLLPTQYDVGVDNNDFTPVSYEEVRMIILKRVERGS